MIVLDLIAVAIVGLFIYIGYKRGFFLSVMSLLVVVIAMVASVIVSSPLSDWTYSHFLDKTVKTTISEQLEEVNGTTAEKIDYVIEHFPKVIKNSLANAEIYSGQDATKKLHIEEQTMEESLVNSLSDKVVRPLIVSILSTAFTILLFVIFIVLLKILSKVVNKAFELPVLKQLNGALGIIIGAVEGCIVVWILALLLFAVANTLPQNGFISRESLTQTYIVRYMGNVKSLNPSDILSSISDINKKG